MRLTPNNINIILEYFVLQNTFTKYDQERYEELLEKNPEWKTIETMIVNEIKKCNNEEQHYFKLLIGRHWRIRQFAHLVASKNGWYSRLAIMYFDYENYCSRCRWTLAIPEFINDDYVCCLSCDGVCPYNCYWEYENAIRTGCYGEKKALKDGTIEFCRYQLKLTKPKRRRRRRWKRGLIIDGG